jgi:hypothetical protein
VGVTSPVSFGEDSCRRLYVASNAGTVYRLEGDSPSPCALPTTGGSALVLATPSAPPRLRLFVQGWRTTKGGAKVLTLLARLAPCGDQAGRRVQLNRGGRPFAAKPLNRACEARFHVRVLRPATFRALFEGQRSQVRTIALAKPRP